MAARVLVTGAAGFIGSNLCRMLLAEGFEVVGLDNLLAGTLENVPEGVDFRKIDICEPNLEEHFQGVDTVFHMAARNCLSDCAEHPVDTARINVMGTANVLKWAHHAGVKHLIYSDTSAEYEGTTQFPSSTDVILPESIYASSKRGGALMCEAFERHYDIKISTVRYFNVYGPAQDWRRVVPPVMSAFTLKLLRKEIPTIYGTGKKSRDFIHVDDVNRFHLMLVKDPSIQGGTYNLGSGKDYSVLEVFQVIQEEMGTDVTPNFKPDLPQEADRTLADISATVATGWRPEIELREGVRRFISYMREKFSEEL